jgi:hypothetical protein
MPSRRPDEGGITLIALLPLKPDKLFSAWRGQDFRRDSYEPLVTVAHAPSRLPVSIAYFDPAVPRFVTGNI